MTINELLDKPVDEFALPPVVLQSGEAIIGTLGNFIVSTGKAKAKKTFNVSAIVAASLINGQVLEYQASFPESKRTILYFDMEQSPYHCQLVMQSILLGLVCGLVIVSCWFFGMGANKLQTASDYDLRYRYLRMQDKATAVDFVHLDSIFITHRNPKAIRQIQQKVVDYEQALQRQVELLLQQKRIKEEQAGLQKHLKQ